MKKTILIITFFLILGEVVAQNQGTNLYLILNENEPTVIKNVYKYVRNNINNPRMKECGVSKLDSDLYHIHYPFYYGLGLTLREKVGISIQNISISQVASLYPQARTAAQLDLDMQPAINADYVLPRKSVRNLNDANTIKYLRSFDKIFVIEYLPNGTAKVVECNITSRH